MNKKFIRLFEDEDLIYRHVGSSERDREGFPMHSHDICEILFVKSGNLICSMDGTNYALRKNNMIIFPAFTLHDVRIVDDSEYERYDILFDESKTVPFAFSEKLTGGKRVFNFDGHESIISLFEKLDYYCEKTDGDIEKLMLTNILQEICVNTLISSESSEYHCEEQSNELINRAVDLINNNLLSLTKIDDICGALFITRSHLHHLFVRYLNTTPKKYIEYKRLIIAQREIACGARPSEIYLKCGFSDYSTFYRAYIRQFGHPPSAERDYRHTIVVSDNSARRDPYSVV